MSRTDKLLTAISFCAVSAGLMAARLIWLVMTRPVDLAEAIGRLW
jgi:hypothetical protein